MKTSNPKLLPFPIILEVKFHETPQSTRATFRTFKPNANPSLRLLLTSRICRKPRCPGAGFAVGPVHNLIGDDVPSDVPEPELIEDSNDPTADGCPVRD